MIALLVAYRPQGVTHVRSKGSYRRQDTHVEVSYFSSNQMVQGFKTLIPYVLAHKHTDMILYEGMKQARKLTEKGKKR
jgi:hypothetical protein